MNISKKDLFEYFLRYSVDNILHGVFLVLLHALLVRCTFPIWSTISENHLVYQAINNRVLVYGGSILTWIAFFLRVHGWYIAGHHAGLSISADFFDQV